MTRPRREPRHRLHMPVPHDIPDERVVVYRWFCRECKVGGTLAADILDPAEHLGLRAELGHNRKSPECMWDDEQVTLCRVQTPATIPNV